MDLIEWLVCTAAFAIFMCGMWLACALVGALFVSGCQTPAPAPAAPIVAKDYLEDRYAGYFEAIEVIYHSNLPDDVKDSAIQTIVDSSETDKYFVPVSTGYYSVYISSPTGGSQ